MSPPRWFRRRRVGLGWRPASWQGWAITVVVVAAVIAVVLSLRGSAARAPVVIVIVAVYAIVALLTGGSKPAAPSRPEEPSANAGPEPAIVSDEQRRALRAVVSSRPEARSGEPVLVVDHLTKRFGSRLAVDDVSFSVAAGEVFGFLGPNGAGKTTTVRMLATLIRPTTGSARIAGLPLEPGNGVAIRERIAVMTESPGLYSRLTVAENLEYFAGLYELARPRERIDLALAAVDLESRADDLCGNLSKGLRQRVALARAILTEPAIVFLDEPTSGLDPVASREVHELIGSLREHGATVFLTTHRLEEAERLCDRVAILNTRLRTIGRPDELRDRLFTKALAVRTAAPLDAPDAVFAVDGVEAWNADGPSRYLLTVADARLAAPEVTRALVRAGADVLSIGEVQHSLEDVYLELVDEQEGDVT